MTNDIVERLRESADDWKFEADNAGRTGGVEELLAEAADEIERLRRRVRKLEDASR
jgi:predicted ATPase